MVAVERDLEVRALADDETVLEEVDPGRQADAAVAVLVGFGDERLERRPDRGIDGDLAPPRQDAGASTLRTV